MKRYIAVWFVATVLLSGCGPNIAVVKPDLPDPSLTQSIVKMGQAGDASGQKLAQVLNHYQTAIAPLWVQSFEARTKGNMKDIDLLRLFQQLSRNTLELGMYSAQLRSIAARCGNAQEVELARTLQGFARTSESASVLFSGYVIAGIRGDYAFLTPERERVANSLVASIQQQTGTLKTSLAQIASMKRTDTCTEQVPEQVGGTLQVVVKGPAANQAEVEKFTTFIRRIASGTVLDKVGATLEVTVTDIEEYRDMRNAFAQLLQAAASVKRQLSAKVTVIDSSGRKIPVAFDNVSELSSRRWEDMLDLNARRIVGAATFALLDTVTSNSVFPEQ